MKQRNRAKRYYESREQLAKRLAELKKEGYILEQDVAIRKIYTHDYRRCKRITVKVWEAITWYPVYEYDPEDNKTYEAETTEVIYLYIYHSKFIEETLDEELANYYRFVQKNVQRLNELKEKRRQEKLAKEAKEKVVIYNDDELPF